jgi:hypothetical protein
VLVFVNPVPKEKEAAAAAARAGNRLEDELRDALPDGEMEIYNQMEAFEQRVRRRIFDIRLVVCCVPDDGVLGKIEAIGEVLHGLVLILVVSRAICGETARIYRLFPKSVLCVNHETGWIAEFIQNKLIRLKEEV